MGKPSVWDKASGPTNYDCYCELACHHGVVVITVCIPRQKMSELEVREDEALKLLEQDDYIPYLLWRRLCRGGFCEFQVWKRWLSAAASSWLKNPWSAFAPSGATSSPSSSGLCEEEAAATSLWMLLLPFLCLSPPPDATTTALMH